MKKVLFTLVAISISILTFSQGVIWNDAIARECAKSFPRLEATRATSPSSFSLERYVPQVYDQGETSMCAAYALATCRTMLYAKYHNYTSTKKIKEKAFSPYFIYYNNVEKQDNKCVRGLGIDNVLNFIMESGFAQIMDVEYPRYYPFTSNRLCGIYPNNYDKDMLSAKAYTIDEVYWLNDINQFKSEISGGRPVCFIMDPFPPTLEAVINQDIWEPNASVQCNGITQNNYRCKQRVKDKLYCYNHISQAEESSLGHVMLIIGYDDYKYGGAFRILNSWGEEWGENGKIWIKYNDFLEYVGKFPATSEWANDPATFSIYRKYD